MDLLALYLFVAAIFLLIYFVAASSHGALEVGFVVTSYNPKWSLIVASTFSISSSDNFPKNAAMRSLLTVVS